MSKNKQTHTENQPQPMPSANAPQQGQIPVKAEYHYESSLPHPSIVEGYRHIDPSFPERIMQEFEKNGQHFRDQDKTALEATREEKKRGQYMAFAITMTGMVAIIVTAFLGMNAASIVSALATAAIIFKGVFTKN